MPAPVFRRRYTPAINNWRIIGAWRARLAGLASSAKGIFGDLDPVLLLPCHVFGLCLGQRRRLWQVNWLAFWRGHLDPPRHSIGSLRSSIRIGLPARANRAATACAIVAICPSASLFCAVTSGIVRPEGMVCDRTPSLPSA